ncbi:hypothetical protein RIF23_03535 [Lipingzhangella sp. LS1_29]|uniref:DUF2567 domain-containing protein n=1 Tax=Lipingzhangella rawalii TaxID=2055835 RepID=A0ABU2H251_9ACTN|nr:hypothetical protein [Lipingzhangella rawalii]MDS1269363.1 hypothetical protein [Lipingzhangella rawalii]
MRVQLVTGATVAAAVAVLGVPAGLLWWWLVPRAEVIVAPDGTTHPGPLPEALFAADGYFAVITAGVGLVCGYLAYIAQYRWSARLHTDLRLVVLVGLAVGAVLGALFAWAVGVAADLPGVERALEETEPGQVVPAPLGIRAYGALVFWPFLALTQYGLVDLVSVLRGDLAVDSAGDFGDVASTEEVNGPAGGDERSREEPPTAAP